MRYRLMATYQGQPYEAGIGPSEGDVVLFAACPPPEELGFEPATGHWRKQLRIHDVQALWESRPAGTFRGEPCVILDDLGDRLHIAFLGHDGYLAEKLGYWQVDRGVFELITPRDEVLDLVEERTDYPHRSAPTTPPGGFARPAAAPVLSPAAPPPASGPAPATDFSPAIPAAPGYSTPPGGSLQPAYSTAPGYDAPSGTLPRRPPSPGLGSASEADAGPGLPPYVATAPGHEPRPSVAMPSYEEPPLPLEAAALRATSAAARKPRPRQDPPAPRPAQRRRRAAPRRLATERIFSELADLAAIPAASYAVGAEVDGAMCLMRTEAGFEVFNAAAGARHEVRRFDDEESAYFYLFGVLAAEAVRTGSLVSLGRAAVPGTLLPSAAGQVPEHGGE
jgi:hypothetical protein